MITEEQILLNVFRPTADNENTDRRSYKLFYDFNRTRTENYFFNRFQAIGSIGNEIEGLIDSINPVIFSPDITYQVESKNIDLIALEFCKANNLISSLEAIYSQVEINFKNLKLLEAEYFVNPEKSKTASIIFKLTLRGKPKNILKDEDNFYKCIRKLVPIDHRKYFSLVYSII